MISVLLTRPVSQVVHFLAQRQVTRHAQAVCIPLQLVLRLAHRGTYLQTRIFFRQKKRETVRALSKDRDF